MDPMQDNLIRFHWQDAFNDNGVTAGRGGGQGHGERKTSKRA